jgi:ribosomal protein S4
MAENINFPESRNLGRLIKNNYSNIAQLKELMTSPPMSAAQHAAIMKKRTEHRRMIEEARELKLATNNGYIVR